MRLHELGVEIVACIEAEKPKAEEPEPEEGRQLDALDDPVRICMNQMAKLYRCSRASRRSRSASASKRPNWK